MSMVSEYRRHSSCWFALHAPSANVTLSPGVGGGTGVGEGAADMGLLRARVILVLATVAAALVLVLPSGAAEAAVRPCSSGLVALTFDDGPASGLTPELLDILSSRHVPATFFMVGERISSAPGAARRVAAGGFGIANHSYHHEQLTRLSDAAIRATIRRTRRAADDAGVQMSRLIRPPYGAINARVRSVLTGMGLVPVLWTVDPEDWRTGRSTDAIASSVLAQLRPHRTNIVLQHDGVGNSPRSVAAVPRIIRTARARGFCFARLGPDGTPVAPVPGVAVSDAQVAERTGSRSTCSDTREPSGSGRASLSRTALVPTSMAART